MTTEKWRKVFIIGILLLVVYLLCAAGVKRYKINILEEARGICEKKAVQCCEEAGFAVDSVEVIGGNYETLRDYSFTVKVYCRSAPEDYSAVYECLCDLERINAWDYRNGIWHAEIYVGEDRYMREYVDSHFLIKNGDTVYDALYWENLDLQEQMPYEGMPEKLINYTMLGHPDKVEDILSVGLKTGKKYYWYKGGMNDLRNLECIVTVSYINRWGKRTVDGYVSSVTVYGQDTTGYVHSYREEEDPLNASDYRTAESFYEANYDAFFSLDDAESYYYEHRND